MVDAFIIVWIVIFIALIILTPIILYVWSFLFHLFRKETPLPESASRSYSLQQVKDVQKEHIK